VRGPSLHRERGGEGREGSAEMTKNLLRGVRGLRGPFKSIVGIFLDLEINYIESFGHPTRKPRAPRNPGWAADSAIHARPTARANKLSPIKRVFATLQKGRREKPTL
jgi:hypothetical protein